MQLYALKRMLPAVNAPGYMLWGATGTSLLLNSPSPVAMCTGFPSCITLVH